MIWKSNHSNIFKYQHTPTNQPTSQYIQWLICQLCILHYDDSCFILFFFVSSNTFPCVIVNSISMLLSHTGIEKINFFLFFLVSFFPHYIQTQSSSCMMIFYSIHTNFDGRIIFLDSFDLVFGLKFSFYFGLVYYTSGSTSPKEKKEEKKFKPQRQVFFWFLRFNFHFFLYTSGSSLCVCVCVCKHCFLKMK